MNAFLEIWLLQCNFFLLKLKNDDNGMALWSCISGAITETDCITDGVRKLCGVSPGLIPENNIEICGEEAENESVYKVCMVHLPSDLNVEVFDIDGKWKSVQEVESLHFDEEFDKEQFGRYVKYISPRIWDYYFDSKEVSVKRVIDNNYDIIKPGRGLPALGIKYNSDNKDNAKDIYDAFQIYGDDLYSQKTKLPEYVNNSLGTGNPIETNMFDPICVAIERLIHTKKYSKYPMPAGDITDRRIVCEYLVREGFSSKLTPENIIFTSSTTHAYNLIMKLIVRPGDVVLFTAPTYGLFVFEPERLGGTSRFVNLSAQNGWVINPMELEKTIKQINSELSECKDFDYSPQVVAFININPHNPTGKVLGKKDKELVGKIAKVCRENRVFVVDDLIYRDLSFRMENKALPVASFDSELGNCITLIGLSKAYGAAGLRAGVLIADESLIRAVRSMLFTSLDSVSELNADALTAAFNPSDERYEAYDKYFNTLMDDYRFRYNLMLAGINGIDSIDEDYRLRVTNYTYSVLGKEKGKVWLQGIEGIHLVEGTEPEAGFFCLVDFTELRGRCCGNWVINKEEDLLKYMFHNYRVNFITGRSIGWPNKDQMIARFSFSVEPEKIVSVLEYIRREINTLENVE